MTKKRFTNIEHDYENAWIKCNDDGDFMIYSIYKELDESLPSLEDLLNGLSEENEQLKSDKEHLMGCLIRFFGYDDEDIDYNLNRESNREYGKQYYSMKEETKKELEE